MQDIEKKLFSFHFPVFATLKEENILIIENYLVNSICLSVGLPRLFISDSETDQISSTVLLLDPNKSSEKQTQSPILRQSMNLELSRSNPNISPQGVD